MEVVPCGTVGFRDMMADMAFLAGIGGVDVDHRYASDGCLVVYECAKLIKLHERRLRLSAFLTVVLSRIPLRSSSAMIEEVSLAFATIFLEIQWLTSRLNLDSHLPIFARCLLALGVPQCCRSALMLSILRLVFSMAAPEKTSPSESTAMLLTPSQYL